MPDPSRHQPGVLETTLPGSERRQFVCPTVEQPKKSGLCVFCGALLAAQRSREHIFARWLVIRYDKLSQPFQVTWNSDADGSVRAQRDLTMANLVAGRVCRECNNGWMCRLEQSVMDMLPAVASGQRRLTDLGAGERELLARWATKTTVAARSADLGPQLVSASHGRILAIGSMPPMHVVARQADIDLGLAWHASQRWLITYPRETRDEAARLVGQSHKTVLAIGQLLIAVCFWPDRPWPVIISRRSHTPLWPLPGSWRTYPHATDRHGVAATQETEIIDMVVGTRVAHPASQRQFASLAASP
jgi:hypothetical protein